MKELLSYSEQLLHLARSMDSSCKRKIKKVKSNYRLVLSAYFARSFELFESILLLVRKDRITDAGVLLRSLSNLIINLGYIAQNKDERSALFLVDGATQHLKLYRKSKRFFDSIGKSNEVDSYIRHYENQKIMLKKLILQKYPEAIAWEDVKIVDRASADPEFQRIYELLYSDLSRFEHHDFSASRAYVDPDTCDPIIKKGAHRHSPVLNHENILLLANIIFGIVLELFDGEYQLKWKDKIGDLVKKLKAIAGI